MISGHNYHRDSFGLLQSVLVGGSTWTPRLVRNTKIALPHIAKNDVFTYKCQFNHDKDLGENADDFHIHIIPIGAVTAGQVIAIDCSWTWLTNGDEFPDTLPNAFTATITLEEGMQYKYLIKGIISNLTFPVGEGYSSELFVQCQRRNDGQDTYPGEFALVDGDSHYPSNKVGSYNVFND
jgi:hypothetical protein